MNVFIREVKAHRKSMIIWSVCILLMVAGGMGKYTGYSGSGQSINELVAKIPQGVRAVLGFGSRDLTTVTGFYAVLFLYLLIMAAIHATMLGANIISKEEQDKTAEFLFTKPVTRAGVLTGKLLAALFIVVIFNIVTLLSTLLMLSYYSKGEPVVGFSIKMMTGMLILQLIFMFLGTGIAAVSKNPRTATPAAAGVMLVTFLLAKAIDLNSNLESLQYLTPFRYFDAERLMSETAFEPVFIILSLIIVSVFVFITYRFFRRRDLKL